MHILIVEDDATIANNLTKMFDASGITSTVSKSASDGLFMAETESYDAIILDWMLPDGEGITICKKLRETKNQSPIIMLTAKSQIEDKIEGLETGADDYLTKPFAFEELLARVKALVRRKIGKSPSPEIVISNLVINTNTNEVKRAGKTVTLAPREYALLEYLAMHKGKTVDRLTLLHHVWGEDIDQMSNTVDVHIRYLRQKIDEPFSQKLIMTVKNKGYLLCED